MPFMLPSSIDWFKHRLSAVSRLLQQRQADYFLDYYKSIKLTAFKDTIGATLTCPICGFFMAELILEQGWSVRACSAVGFKQIIDNPEFSHWFKNLIKDNSSDLLVVNNDLSISSK